MARLGMVIDLQRCVGCGACAFACKAENNTRNRGNGQSFNWADFVMQTEGTFPNVVHAVMPVMCNHCSDAPCVKVCPASPEAIYKTPDGITMYDSSRCVGCQACQNVCPYSNVTLDGASLNGESYSVISFNTRRGAPQPHWSDTAEVIPGCTASGAATSAAAGATIPAMNAFVSEEIPATRQAGVIEKCTLCYHRVSNGLQPACVEVCPAKARIFGDQDDPGSEIARVLKANASFRLKEDRGTKPNVSYIGKYTVRT